MNDQVIKNTHKIMITISGKEQCLKEWSRHPKCKVTEKQLRNRIWDYQRGSWLGSVADLVFKSSRSRNKPVSHAQKNLVIDALTSDWGMKSHKKRRANIRIIRGMQ